MVTYEDFQARYQAVLGRVGAACAKAGRPLASVRLLPVTKTHPVEAAQYAARAGILAVGENRVQEAAAKRLIGPPELQWELIGHLQSNKAKLAIETFDRIQSVDSIDLANRLGRVAGELGKKLPILLQVNAGDDPAKFGTDIDGATALMEAALQLPALRVEGLMTVPPLSDDPEVAQKAFDRLRTCRDDLAARFKIDLPELSMGMSDDLEVAILAGSTCIRIGSALYGQRANVI
jgi:pyridoxal phosphate enzyme (YggS family)